MNIILMHVTETSNEPFSCSFRSNSFLPMFSADVSLKRSDIPAHPQSRMMSWAACLGMSSEKHFKERKMLIKQTN